MKILFKFLTVFVLLHPCFQNVFALTSDDKVAIEKIVQDLADSWNEKEGVGFGVNFSDDADFVNIFGMHFSGKAEIEDRHIKILQTMFKNSKLQMVKTTLREIQPGVVIALIQWKLDAKKSPITLSSKYFDEIREGIFTNVFLYANNKWVITASQNVIKPYPLSKSTSH